jgi:hypothetical protein
MTWVLVAVIAALLVERGLANRAIREDQAGWRLERANLLQRIQAPEVAVVRHDAGEVPVNPPAVNGFDDEDYWDAQRALVSQIERLERGL